MTLEDIKQKINELAKEHAVIDDDSLDSLKDAEWIEMKAEEILVDYCEGQDYLINGFPKEHRRLYEEEHVEEYDEYYFSHERFRLYLDMLTLEKADVADLTWHYNNVFWPDAYDSKEEFIAQVKHQVECGTYYDLKI